jgi:hypothetical protein
MTRFAPARTRLLLQPLEARDLPSFLPPVSYTVSGYPEDVAIADVNGDGRRDVVVADAQGATGAVAVLLGKGDGTLLAPVFYGTGPGPFGLWLVDLNGDSKLDVVTSNYGGNSVSVLLNNGNGTFQPAITYPGIREPYKVAAGDVDGDGIPDVAVSTYSGTDLWVLHGNGDGTLGAPKAFTVTDSSNSVHIADFDGDGVGDISVDSYFGGVTVIYGNGVIHTYATSDAWGHAVADLNGDGRPDLVASNFRDPYVSVLLNQGNGTFGGQTSAFAGQENYFPAVADFNRDRKPDVVVVHFGVDDGLDVLLGKGDGKFGRSAEYHTGQNYARAVAAGDLNGDGYPDLAVADKTNTISILLNDGNWTPPIPPPWLDQGIVPLPLSASSPPARPQQVKASLLGDVPATVREPAPSSAARPARAISRVSMAPAPPLTLDVWALD